MSDLNVELYKVFGVWGKKKRYGKEYEGVIRSIFILNLEGEIVWKKINVRVKGYVVKVFEEVKKLIGSEE